jgi:peptidoglycan/LPS O-acetylase OafA/YrhL
MRGLRTDIQVLRAIAVLSVLVFHFELPGLQKGFLGVDIFFVISGYLMSGVIMGEMDHGHFSAPAFYLRRARRLLPAALATLLCTTALVPFVLTPSLLRDYAWQLLGTLGFSANLVLWQQSGYFEGPAALKPLLHMWSLSLEEQFYFLLPLVLVLARPRWRLVLLITLLLGSAAACFALQANDPTGTFYLLPTRAWELLMGSLCALPVVQSRASRLLSDRSWIGLLLMAFALVKGVDAVHPRGDALLVCLATAGVILCPSKALGSSHPWMGPVHWIGDRSYSLYLVHWPLIALAKSVWLEGVPMEVHVTLLGLSFLLAHASYEWIEQPARHIASAKMLVTRLVWLALPLMALACWMGFHLYASRGPAPKGMDWQQALRPNYGFARVCDTVRDYRPRPECANASKPRTLVWGDSYAMHLVPALVASGPEGGIAQATRSACAPLLDMARRMPDEPANKSRRCLSFNESLLKQLARSPDTEFVVLSARWHYLFTDPLFDGTGRQVRPSTEAVTRSLAATIGQLRRMGKKVILVSPPASIGPDVNLGLCTERRALHLWTIMPSTDAQCGFAQRLHMAHNGQVLAMLQATSEATGTPLVRLDDFTCENGRCRSTLEGVPLYRDAGHLSHDGSRVLGRLMGLGKIVAQQAR